MPDIQTIDTDYKPWGGLAGYYNSVVNDAIQQSNQNMLERQGYENVVRSKDAAVAQMQKDSPDWMNWNLRGDIGKYKSSDATGQYDQAVLPYKTNQATQELKNKFDLDKLREHATNLDRLKLSLSSENPAAVAEAMQSLDPQDQQQLGSLIQARGLPAAVKFLQSQSDSIKNTLALNEQTRSKMMEEDQKGENTRKNTELTNRGHLAVTNANIKGQKELEQMRIDAGKYAKVLQDKWGMFMKKKPVDQLSEVRAALTINKNPITGEPLTEEDTVYWNEWAKTTADIINARNTAATTNKADVGALGLTPTNPVQVPGAVQAGASGSTSTVRKWNPTTKKWE